MGHNASIERSVYNTQLHHGILPSLHFVLVHLRLPKSVFDAGGSAAVAFRVLKLRETEVFLCWAGSVWASCCGTAPRGSRLDQRVPCTPVDTDATIRINLAPDSCVLRLQDVF